MAHGMSHLRAEQVPRIRFGQRIRGIDLPGDLENDNMPFFMPLLNGKALRINVAHSGCRTSDIGNVEDSLIVNVDRHRLFLRHAQLTQDRPLVDSELPQLHSGIEFGLSRTNGNNQL